MVNFTTVLSVDCGKETNAIFFIYDAVFGPMYEYLTRSKLMEAE